MATSPVPTATPVWSATPFAKQYVNSVSTSADGAMNVAGTFFFDYKAGATAPAAPTATTQGIFAWNAAGTRLWSDTFEATEGFYWVSVSRDGSTVAGGGAKTWQSGFVNAYDAKGNSLLSGTVGSRTNMLALSEDGTYLVAGADQLYLYTNSGQGFGEPSVQSLAFTQSPKDSVQSVGISLDGSLIVFTTLSGFVVLVPNTNGKLGPISHWHQSTVSIHWVAIAADGSSFVAAGTVPAPGGGAIFYFKTKGFSAQSSYAWTAPLSTCQNCRNVAISDDGKVVTAVGAALPQQAPPSSAPKLPQGFVYCFEDQGTSGVAKWSRPLVNQPNCSTMDSAGSYIVAADGYPDGTPGQFYLFDSTGTPIWVYPTTNMSWPIQLTAGANAAFAGSDDSSVYYFTQGLSGGQVHR